MNQPRRIQNREINIWTFWATKEWNPVPFAPTASGLTTELLRLLIIQLFIEIWETVNDFKPRQ